MRRKNKTTNPPDKIIQAAELKRDNPNLTYKQLAQMCHTTPQNLHQAFKRYHIDYRRVQTYRALEADILAGYQERLLTGITDAKIDKASVKDIAISAGILADKREMIQRKTASRELISDIVERLATQRKITKITIEQSEPVNIVNSKIIDTEIIADVS